MVSGRFWKYWNLSLCCSRSELSLGPVYPRELCSFPGPAKKSLQISFFSNLCVWLYFPRGKWTACCHFHVLVLHTGLPPAAPYDQCLFPAKLLGPGAHVPEDLLGVPLINSLPALRISLELCVPAPVRQPAKTFNLSWVILTHLYAQSLWVLLKLESQEDPVLAELWLLGLS